MTTINTVTGPVPASALGRVLVNEQVFSVNEDFRINYLPEWDDDAEVARAVHLLDELKESGIDTLVDVSVLGLGRNIERVKRVAEQTELKIIASTGLFTYNDLPYQFHYTGPGLGFNVPEPMADLFIRDLTVGIANTGVKATMLVCVIEAEGLTDGVERVMRAVGMAGVATGAPIMVHTNPHTQSGLIAQRVLAEEGVDLSNVLLSHSGDTADVDYLMRAADAGSVLGMDRFGLDVLLPHDDRVATVVELAERGYADRMALSQGASSFSDWFDPGKRAEVVPDWTYFEVSRRVVPELLSHGVSEHDVDLMLRGVPQRFLSGRSADQGLVTPISANTGLNPD
ncbi:MAG: phosphotriesterase-related protein [Gordonia sp. (in: high G+C Gram-positive bacteria)]